VGLYPQLAMPPPAAGPSTVTGGAAPAARALRSKLEDRDLGRLAERAPMHALRAAEPEEDRYNVYRLDPNALIPTGPGLPRWSWQTIWLSWRGPVERDQRLHLMLASPRVNRMLAFLRVALTGLLLACVAGGALRSGGLPASAARALVLALVVLGTASHARAEFPSPDLLGELQKRLLERPE